jgi:hypothetical protein
MRRRKNSIANDSLELLLDTMCNTFGGVMFIAIALCVISAMMPVNIAEQRLHSEQNQIEQVNNELKSIEQEIADLRRINISKQKIIKTHSDVNTEKHVERLMFIKDINRRLEGEIEGQRDLINKTNQETIQKQQNTAEINIKMVRNKNESSRKIDAINQQIIQSKKKLEQERENASVADERKINFAKLSSTSKAPFAVLLADGKLYRINRYDASLCIDGSIYASDDVSFSRLTSNESIFSFVAVPGRGTDINPDKDKNVALSQIFNKINNRDNFIFIFVCKKSFAKLMPLIKYLRHSGFSFDWQISEHDNRCDIVFVRNASHKSLD